MKWMIGVFLLLLGIMLSWNTVIADDSFFVVPVKAQFTSWDKKIPGSTRFKLVLDGEAVLDRETGLVWERIPSVNNDNWYYSCNACLNKVVGGRKGWRPPTIEELFSLVDPSESSPPHLPAGHPFDNVNSSYYWSSNTYPGDSNYARLVHFFSGDMTATSKTGSNAYIWCVRGGHGYDGQYTP